MADLNEKRLEVKRAQLRALQQKVKQPSGAFTRENITGAARTIDDFVRSLASGVTSGFADEIAAKAGELTGIGEQAPGAETFEERVAAERARDEAIPAGVAIPGQILGGAGAVMAGGALAPGAAAALQAIPRTLPNLIATGAAGGAAGGALQGAGSAVEGERVGGALQGAALGALTGAAAGPALVGAGNLISAINRRLKDPASKAVRQALTKIRSRLQNEDITEDVARARIARMGEEGVLADIGTEGGPLQGLARAAGQGQGRGRAQAQRVLLGRARRQGRRVKRAIQGIVAGEDAARVSGDLIEDRARTANIMYDRAFAAQPEGGLRGEAIDELLELPAVQRAITEWRNVDPRAAALPDNSLQALDRAYKNIGGRAIELRRSGAGPQADSMNELRTELRDAIVDQVGEYGAALDTFSSRSQLIDALQEGQQIFKRHPEEIRKFIAGLGSEAEREQFQIGLSSALQERLSTVAEQGDATKKIFGNEFLRERVRAAFPNKQDFRNFTRIMIGEARKARTQRIVTPSIGSQTTPRQLEAEDVIPGGIIEDVRTGIVSSPKAAALSRGAQVLEDTVNRLKAGPEETREEIVKRLLTPGQQENTQIIDELFRQEVAKRLGAGTAAIGGAVSGQQAGRQPLEITVHPGQAIRRR